MSIKTKQFQGVTDAFGQAPKNISRLCVSLPQPEVERLLRLQDLVQREATRSKMSCALTTEMDPSVALVFVDSADNEYEQTLPFFTVSEFSWIVEPSVIELKAENEMGDHITATFTAESISDLVQSTSVRKDCHDLR